MKAQQTDHGTLEIWSAAEVAAAFNDDSVAIIDVRTPQEYMLERIEGALLMPLAHFAPSKLPSQEGKRLVFHCGSGVRSERAARLALEAGLDNAAHLEGGLGAWKESGLAYISVNKATGEPERENGDAGG